MLTSTKDEYIKLRKKMNAMIYDEKRGNNGQFEDTGKGHSREHRKGRIQLTSPPLGNLAQIRKFYNRLIREARAGIIPLDELNKWSYALRELFSMAKTIEDRQGADYSEEKPPYIIENKRLTG